MKKLTYLAVLEPLTDSYDIYFPDLPGCISVANNLAEAQDKAKEALELHIYGMEKDGEQIPEASITLGKEDTEGNIIIPVTIFPSLVRSEMANRRVKTNCTIPAWLKELGEEKGANYSKLLETALKEYLNVDI